EASEQTPYPKSTSTNGYSWSSYAGSAGTFDIWHWWCGCPPSPPYGGAGPSGHYTPIARDGGFFYNVGFPNNAIPARTSNTIFVGEFSRFKNDPDSIFNTWARAAWFGSNYGANTSRPEGMASVIPRINAPFQPANDTNFPSTYLPTGDVDGWLFTSGSA